MAAYTRPEVLVETDWVVQNLGNPNVRVIEVGETNAPYEEGHVPGSVGWNWSTQLVDPTTKEPVSKFQLEQLLGKAGIDANMTVVLYGNHDNRFATWTYWLLSMYGHPTLRIMNGGRRKWLAEARELSKYPRRMSQDMYKAVVVDNSLRASQPEVLEALEQHGSVLLNTDDAGANHAHLPGAQSVPWSSTVNADGTFKNADDLHQAYEGIGENDSVIVYGSDDAQSSHSWFVLKYLLGYPSVKNFHGSLSEYEALENIPLKQTA